MKPKSPTVAVLLNAIPFVMGLGYIYIGKWVGFLIVFGLQVFSLFFMTRLGLRQYNGYLLLVLWVASMVDIYNRTKKLGEVQKA